jgi:hypothetical protein
MPVLASASTPGADKVTLVAWHQGSVTVFLSTIKGKLASKIISGGNYCWFKFIAGYIF